MIQAKKVGTNVYSIIDDGAYAAATANPANVNSSSNILNVGGIQYQLDTLLIGEGGDSASALIYVGSITYEEMNAGDAAATFSKTFEGAKPEDKILIRAYYTTERFVSATRDTAAIDVDISGTDNAAILNLTGTFGYAEAVQPYEAADLTLTVEFAADGNNPKDFTEGVIHIWAEVIDAPALVVPE
jgi:hypothetical protein